MRYELTEYKWTAIKPMLPNKSRGVRRVDDTLPSSSPAAQWLHSATKR